MNKESIIRAFTWLLIMSFAAIFWAAVAGIVISKTF